MELIFINVTFMPACPWHLNSRQSQTYILKNLFRPTYQLLTIFSVGANESTFIQNLTYYRSGIWPVGQHYLPTTLSVRKPMLIQTKLTSDKRHNWKVGFAAIFNSFINVSSHLIDFDKNMPIFWNLLPHQWSRLKLIHIKIKIFLEIFSWRQIIGMTRDFKWGRWTTYIAPGGQS